MAVNRTTRRVAVQLSLGNAHGQNLFRGIAAYVRKSYPEPFVIEMAQVGTEQRSEWHRGIHGLIIQASTEKLVTMALEIGIPAVNVSGFINDERLPMVRPDSVAIGRMAAAHLIDRGFRQLAAVGVEGVALSVQRLDGFAAAAAGAGVPCMLRRIDRVTMWRLNNLGDRTVLREWIGGLPRPVGVMTHLDETGRIVLEVCQEMGVRVPDEVAVVGVDNDELICETCRPPLSSVDAGVDRVGFAAASMIARLMAGEAVESQLVEIEPARVVTRQSTNVMAVSDPDVAAAMEVIHSHSEGELTVGHILSRVPVTRRTLERKFRRVLDRSPHDEIRRAQIQRIKQMLTETDWPLRRIARSCGFKYVSHMVTVFRKSAGMPPAAYRRANTRRAGRPGPGESSGAIGDSPVGGRGKALGEV